MPKTWFITGTSSGFGREMTEILLERGDRVAATLRSPTRLDGLADRYGDQLWRAESRRHQHRADARGGCSSVRRARTDRRRRFQRRLRTDWPGGRTHRRQIRRQLDTNVIAPIQLVRAVTPYLREQGGGLIMQTSSMGAHLAYPAMSLYHASKWGIEGFFEAYALEVAPFGIHTTLIEPGMVATDFYASVDAAPSRLPAYAETQAAAFTHGASSVALDDMPGDPHKVAEAMIRTGDLPEPPRRQLLGSDAYRLVREALRARLDAVEAQRAVALTTDRDGYVAAVG